MLADFLTSRSLSQSASLRNKAFISVVSNKAAASIERSRTSDSGFSLASAINADA